MWMVGGLGLKSESQFGLVCSGYIYPNEAVEQAKIEKCGSVVLLIENCFIFICAYTEGGGIVFTFACS